jgi:signal transduction histidine kinase
VLYTAAPIVDVGNLGAVRMTQSVKAIDERIRRDVLGLAAVGLAALAFGLLFAWVLANVLSRPLRSLAAAARRVEAGDLEARAEPGGASEQKEVAEAFNDMTDRLSRVLEAQRDFVANASHQLRTPLTGLRLRIEAAALKADDPGLASELDAAEREAERLARLVTSLLALAREGDRPGVPRPVSLPDAARAAVERWESQGRVVAHGEDDAFAAASEEDVAIVLDNAIENALRYAPPGSEVAIGWRREGDRAVLVVDDEGPGLRPGEEAQVFERFARGSAGRAVSGSGLGLPIVATLARRWGGSASLRNRPEGGARARIEWPAAQGQVLPSLNRELDRALPGPG